jgi:hypothetical protein
MAEKIAVAIKTPHGLHLDIQSAAGVRERVTLKGFVHDGAVGGFGITENVEKAHFDQWMKENKDLAIVKKGLIFAHVQLKSVTDQAKEKVELKSGLERLDPSNPMLGIEPMKAVA